MAPQKNYQQDLQAPLIPSEEQQGHSPQESLSEQSSLLGEQLDVIIVQPETHSGSSSSLIGDAGTDPSVMKSGKMSQNMKGNNKKGAEVPVNCPHLETALFFFGIAGMLVSVLMLLQHLVGNLISYY